MVNMNFLILALSALIPMIMGFIWYHPKVIGNVYMKVTDLTDEKIKGSNMALIFIVSYLFCFFIAVTLQFLVIHQFHISSILFGEPDIMTEGSATNQMMTTFKDTYGDRFRTFGHGALHGVITAVLFITPIIGVNALFERKSFKYILLNGAYWTICVGLMGGVICQFT